MTVIDDMIKEYKQQSSYRLTETNYRSSNDYTWNTINRSYSKENGNTKTENGNTKTPGSRAYGVHEIMMYNESNMQIINK